jgi:hypothetical protein
MFALKSLGLFETAPVSQSTWGELIRDRIGNSGKADEKLRKHLTKSNVADVDAAVDAIKWLELLDNTPLGLLHPFDIPLLDISPLLLVLSIYRNQYPNRCSLESS